MKDVTETVRTEKAQTIKNRQGRVVWTQEQAQGSLGHYLYQKLGNNLNVFQQKNGGIFKYAYNKIPSCSENG